LIATYSAEFYNPNPKNSQQIAIGNTMFISPSQLICMFLVASEMITKATGSVTEFWQVGGNNTNYRFFSQTGSILGKVQGQCNEKVELIDFSNKTYSNAIVNRQSGTTDLVSLFREENTIALTGFENCSASLSLEDRLTTLLTTTTSTTTSTTLSHLNTTLPSTSETYNTSTTTSDLSTTATVKQDIQIVSLTVVIIGIVCIATIGLFYCMDSDYCNTKSNPPSPNPNPDQDDFRFLSDSESEKTALSSSDEDLENGTARARR